MNIFNDLSSVNYLRKFIWIKTNEQINGTSKYRRCYNETIILKLDVAEKKNLSDTLVLIQFQAAVRKINLWIIAYQKINGKEIHILWISFKDYNYTGVQNLHILKKFLKRIEWNLKLLLRCKDAQVFVSNT